jgi:hypothetical protein
MSRPRAIGRDGPGAAIHERRQAVEEGTWMRGAAGLTRTLSLVVLALMLVALVFSGWVAVRYLGQIHV